MTESELREKENIKKAITHVEKVEKYNTNRFVFTNEKTGKSYDAGYFYLESVGALEKEFNERDGDRSVFKSCKLVVDLRQDYVKNNNTTTQNNKHSFIHIYLLILF